MTQQVTILTLFPEMFPGPLGCSLIGKAMEKNLWQLKIVNIRDFAEDKHQTVDDTCFGGGGLVWSCARMWSIKPLLLLWKKGKPV